MAPKKTQKQLLLAAQAKGQTTFAHVVKGCGQHQNQLALTAISCGIKGEREETRHSDDPIQPTKAELGNASTAIAPVDDALESLPNGITVRGLNVVDSGIVCETCGQEIASIVRARCLSKGKGTYRCGTCSSRLTMLYRAFGKWPCDGWENISKEEERDLFLMLVKPTAHPQ